LSVVYFLLMVGVLVTIHELGHFFAAKAMGVKVQKLSIGFGPAALRFVGRETEYQIGVIPLGGYVRMLGEDPADAVTEDERDRSFAAKPLWRRAVVVLAGPAANLLLPLFVYFAFYAGHTELPAAVIGDVVGGGPAALAGIEPGDRVVEIDGRPIRYWEELEEMVDARAGQVMRFGLERRGTTLYKYVTPQRTVMRARSGERGEQGLIGVVQAPFVARVGVLDPASPAARAGLASGDVVASVDGHPVASYAELEEALKARWKRAAIAYLRPRPAAAGFADIRVLEAGLADVVAERKAATGLASAELFVAAVEPGSPAARAGLRPGDQLTTLDGAPLQHWLLLEQALLAAPERRFRLGWLRARPGGGVVAMTGDVAQERKAVVDEYGQAHDHIVFGARTDFRAGLGARVPVDGRMGYAAGHAVERTAVTIGLMARGLGALVSGHLPGGTVGGPIMVYRMASVSGQKGWDAFWLMLALVSINLGLINLLPIPMLDGGQLTMLALEAVRRRRLSPRAREGAVVAGLVVIVSLTVLALRNDIVRYLLH
jgi:regulator of sigma E protease